MKIYNEDVAGGLTIGNMRIPQGHRFYTQALLEVEAGEAEILPYVEPPTQIPQVVTMRQARLALLSQGLLSGVDAAIATLEDPPKSEVAIEWEYSQTVERSRPFVTLLGNALGLDEVELDDLFTLAATL